MQKSPGTYLLARCSLCSIQNDRVAGAYRCGTAHVPVACGRTARSPQKSACYRTYSQHLLLKISPTLSQWLSCWALAVKLSTDLCWVANTGKKIAFTMCPAREPSPMHTGCLARNCLCNLLLEEGKLSRSGVRDRDGELLAEGMTLEPALCHDTFQVALMLMTCQVFATIQELLRYEHLQRHTVRRSLFKAYTSMLTAMTV